MTTDLSGGKPDGAVESGGVKTLQTYTEDSVMSAVSGGVRNSWGVAKGNFITDFIGGLFQGMTDVLNGINPANWIPDPAKKYAQTIRDGQRDLNDQTDLLSPLLDYGSWSCDPGAGEAKRGKGRMPFTYQLGPSRGMTDMGDGRIRLDEKGLWDLRAVTTVSWYANPLNQDTSWYLRVIKPDGGINSVYSEQGCFMSTLRSTTMSLTSSVVIPEAGYFVDVYVITPHDRAWWTGPKWTRLSIQHISRDVSFGTGSEESTPPSNAS